MSSFIVEQVRTETQHNHADVFPLIYAKQAGEDSLLKAIAWVKQNQTALMEQLSRHGAILFRDFPVVSDIDFDAFLSAFDLPNFTYADSLSNMKNTKHSVNSRSSSSP